MNLKKMGMPTGSTEQALEWRDVNIKTVNPRCGAHEWSIQETSKYMSREIKMHARKSVYPDWSILYEKEQQNKMFRENPQVRWAQIFRQHWIAWEINAHSRRSVFPDWGDLAIRYMENKRRDNKACYAKRRASALKQKREYRQRPEVRVANRKRIQKLVENDHGFRVRRNLSRRLSQLMSQECNNKNGRSVLEFVGCAQNEIKAHIERQFKKWMNWGNYGTKWHIDHIIPCASFDHSDEAQVRKCWHWTNLRPLCAKKNVAKRDKITAPQMALPIGFH